MGWWDYTNIGASAEPKNKKFVEKIFEYVGYGSDPDYASDGDECSFYKPDVYHCMCSDNEYASGHLQDGFEDFDEIELLNLLNALFPNTTVYVHSASGNNTSDTWENHDMVYDTDSMTLECLDSYTDYGGDGPNGSRSWKERFVLNAPQTEYVEALIKCSKEDGNTELTALLQTLLQKLKDGLIVYKEDEADTRQIGVEYDVEEEGCLDDFEDEDDYYEDEDEDDEDEDE